MAEIIGFAIWSVVGCAFIGWGIYTYFSKKLTVTSLRLCEVTDIKKYNHAVAKLFCAYGIIFILLGIPLLPGQNFAWIFLSVLGAVVESIIAMVVYLTIIEKKYKK